MQGWIGKVYKGVMSARLRAFGGGVGDFVVY